MLANKWSLTDGQAALISEFQYLLQIIENLVPNNGYARVVASFHWVGQIEIIDSRAIGRILSVAALLKRRNLFFFALYTYRLPAQSQSDNLKRLFYQHGCSDLQSRR
jgi:hypothetical protein